MEAGGGGDCDKQRRISFLLDPRRSGRLVGISMETRGGRVIRQHLYTASSHTCLSRLLCFHSGTMTCQNARRQVDDLSSCLSVRPSVRDRPSEEFDNEQRRRRN